MRVIFRIGANESAWPGYTSLNLDEKNLILERVFGLPRIDLASVRDAYLAWATSSGPFVVRCLLIMAALPAGRAGTR